MKDGTLPTATVPAFLNRRVNQGPYNLILYLVLIARKAFRSRVGDDLNNKAFFQ